MINSLDFTRDLSSLLGAGSSAEREILAETGVGGRQGGGEQEIHGDLNWEQFSGEWLTQLRQSITWEKIAN